MFDPQNMEKMMKQMGMDMEQVDAERVVVETADGRELVFEAPDLHRMDVKGKTLFQLQGDYEERDTSAEEDLELVMEKTGASREEAEAALEEHDDLTDAIMSLQ